jgi:superfamily I DNA and/or RNA helicase
MFLKLINSNSGKVSTLTTLKYTTNFQILKTFQLSLNIKKFFSAIDTKPKQNIKNSLGHDISFIPPKHKLVPNQIKQSHNQKFSKNKYNSEKDYSDDYENSSDINSKLKNSHSRNQDFEENDFSDNYISSKEHAEKSKLFWNFLKENREFTQIDQGMEMSLRHNWITKFENWTKRANVSLKIKYSRSRRGHQCMITLICNETNNTFSIIGNFSKNSQKDSKKRAYESLYLEMKRQKLLGLIFKRKVVFKNFYENLKRSVLKKDIEEYKSLINQADGVDFSTSQIDEIYDLLLSSLDIEFSEVAGSLVFEKLTISNSEFLSQSDCEYYKFSRFMVFFETIEGILLNMRALGRKTSLIMKIHKRMNTNYFSMEEYKGDSKGDFLKTKDEFESEEEHNKENSNLFESQYNNPQSNFGSLSQYSNSKIVPDSANREDRDISSIIKNDYVLIHSEEDPELKILGHVGSIESDFKMRISTKVDLKEKIIYKVTKLTTGIPTETYAKNLREFCVNHSSCCDKLRSIITRSKELDDKIHDLAKEKINTLPEDFKLQNQKLTPNQQEAVFQSLTQRLTLIQGPPGTGKTRTAAEIVREWVKFNPTSTILVTADSNIAVDNIFKELLKLNIKALRVGSNTNLREYFNTGSSSTRAFQLMKKNTENINVVCATCVGSSAGILEKFNFERVIIDEAAQSTEVSNIATLVNKTKQLVIIGDHKQLPPTIQSKIAEKYGYSLSLFERLVNTGIKPVFLNIQYRMHPLIAEFPSREFYQGELLTGITKEDRPIIQGFNWPQLNIPVCFMNVENSHESFYAKSYYNLTECEVIRKIYEGFVMSGDVYQDQIGIVTPYSGQKEKLTSFMKKLKLPGQRQKYGAMRRRSFGNEGPQINVNTVDGFQGMEKELILFSAVRSNNNVRQ